MLDLKRIVIISIIIFLILVSILGFYYLFISDEEENIKEIIPQEEITEEQKQQLDEKAMFLFRYHDKDIFKYKPDETVKDISRVMVYFRKNDKTSLSEEYNKLKKQQEDTIERIDMFIGKKLGHMESEMMRITNYTKIYGEFTDLLESIDDQKHYLKVPYRFEIIDILDAMRLAFGLLDEEKVKGYHQSEYKVGMDSDYILELATIIKNHWTQMNDYHENYRKNIKKLISEKNNDKPLPSVEVQIEQT